MKPSIAFSAVLNAVTLTILGGEEDVTYSRDVAPVIQSHCAECHRDRGGAPFPLQTYRDASRRSRMILRVVEDRYMPPWHATGGDVPLEGDRRLDPDEIAILQQWVKAGKPEGDPGDLPAPRQFKDGWRLGEPDLILKMKEPYQLPAEGPDIYRNFVVPTGLKKKRFLRAIEFRPGSPQVVHHALIFADSKGKARKADGEDDAPGFGEMPIDGATGNQIGGWVPGSIPRELPEGLSHRLDAGSDIVLQVHFHLSGKPESEQSLIGLYFDEEAPTREFTSLQIPPLFGAFSGIDLKPGAENSAISDSFELPVDVHAFGAHAHAHYRGKALRMVAKLPDGSDLTLLNVPDWDMDWQEEYRFSSEVFLPAGTRVDVDVAWDNSADSSDNPIVPPVRVRWGFESYDEMGSIDLFVIPASGKKQAAADMKKLKSAYREHVVWTAAEHVIASDKLAVFGELRKNAIARFDTNGDGVLGFKEKEAAAALLKKSAQ